MPLGSCRPSPSMRICTPPAAIPTDSVAFAGFGKERKFGATPERGNTNTRRDPTSGAENCGGGICSG